MKKFAVIFVIAVILPSGALAWLALRSLHDEQLILQERQRQLCQTVADSFARQAETYVSDRQREFAGTVEALLSATNVAETASRFDDSIRKSWPHADVGFAVTLDGSVLSPNMLGRSEGRRFRVENDKFLCSRESIEVYVSTMKGTVNLRQLDEASASDEKVEASKLIPLKGKARVVSPGDVAGKGEMPSKVASEETDFRQIVGGRSEGVVARFLQNKLHVMCWYRSARDYQTVFGAELSLARVRDGLREVVNSLDPGLSADLCVVILDDAGRPAALSRKNFQADWKRPQAASEIGEMLPHWEAAVYPINPLGIERAANAARWTIGVLIAVLLFAIAFGSLLLLADLRRQLIIARQKSDFVSNVSHELKTPLTSIRMFSELLAEDRVPDSEKRKTYLRIISTETARLTRLINNILDFARMEKGEKKYRLEPCDLVQIVTETLQSYRPQLEAHRFSVEVELPEEPVPICGDGDALAQVILNLLSNAEKYSGDRKEVRVELKRVGLEAELRVLDRGVGVPAGCGEKIFEQFFRAHDSLSSGIQGSGLGLTLARQIARAHQGEVYHEPRPGGGSVFVLELPIANA